MKGKIDSALSRPMYAMRLAIAEPPFAHICRVTGLTRFTLHGKEKVNSQWQLFYVFQNLNKLHRYKDYGVRLTKGCLRSWHGAA